jgi:hypothetical protein
MVFYMEEVDRMEDEEFDQWQERLESEAWSLTHEQRMHTLHEVAQRRLDCNDLGPAECTCTRTWFEPRGVSGDWKDWEDEIADCDHNALLDNFAGA